MEWGFHNHKVLSVGTHLMWYKLCDYVVMAKKTLLRKSNFEKTLIFIYTTFLKLVQDKTQESSLHNLQCENYSTQMIALWKPLQNFKFQLRASCCPVLNWLSKWFMYIFRLKAMNLDWISIWIASQWTLAVSNLQVE